MKVTLEEIRNYIALNLTETDYDGSILYYFEYEGETFRIRRTLEEITGDERFERYDELKSIIHHNQTYEYDQIEISDEDIKLFEELTELQENFSENYERLDNPNFVEVLKELQQRVEETEELDLGKYTPF